MLTLEKLKEIPAGTLWRTVVTQYHNWYYSKPGELITFNCIKGYGWDDWAIYGCRYDAAHPIPNDAENMPGEKVLGEALIRDIVPCTDEVYKKYRP